MKKQILMLTVCLSLTTTFALGANNIPIANKTPQQIENNITLQTKQQKLAEKEFTQRVEARRKKDIAKMYNELGLSQDTISKADAILLGAAKEMKPLLDKFNVDQRQLLALKAKKAFFLRIWIQKIIIYFDRKDIERCDKSSKEAFKKLLTNEQKATYEKLMLEKKEQIAKMRASQR